MSVLDEIFASSVKGCGYAGFSNRQQKLGLHALCSHPAKSYWCTERYLHDTVQAESYKKEPKSYNYTIAWHSRILTQPESFTHVSLLTEPTLLAADSTRSEDCYATMTIRRSLLNDFNNCCLSLVPVFARANLREQLLWARCLTR